jgi:hypothetical protein
LTGGADLSPVVGSSRRGGGGKFRANYGLVYNSAVDEEAELQSLRKQAREDRGLVRRAAEALAQIDRSQGLSDEHADVLAALRIRLEGKPRASLEDLLGAAGDVGAGRRLDDALSGGEESSSEWPAIEESKRDWPG